MVFPLLAIPGISVVLFLLLKDNKTAHVISLISSSLLLLCGVGLTRAVVASGTDGYAQAGFFYVDALNLIILDIVLIVSFVAAVYSVSYLNNEIKEGALQPQRMHLYYMLMYGFIFTMILALTVDNMGVFWIAIEATTLASAFLVGFQNDKHSLEAAWKYIIICSVGIAIALLGIILLHLSSIDVLTDGAYLDWTALYDRAGELKTSITRLAFLFILIGFGTKAGLAPMHTWLPDAHSQAPSPISALLSGVLLNSAMYGIIRTVSIVNKNTGSNHYTGRLLIAAGLLSILTAAVFILTQKDYKRLLAYSSIEHMGLIALAVGLFTPLSVLGGLLHMINHSFTKSMLFLSSGTILQKFGTKKIKRITGIVKVLPITGTAFFLGLFAIAGVPPFSVFTSELCIIMSLFEAKYSYIGFIVIVLLSLVFAGIAATLFRTIYGESSKQTVEPGEINKAGAGAIILLLVLICTTGLFLPEMVTALLEQARDIVIGI
ncbi:MAG: hydrogenase 4 subunit F [Eubacteriales bacterium]|nr:hydrogenase 4 subunit F [Eubacteriales bacterium]